MSQHWGNDVPSPGLRGGFGVALTRRREAKVGSPNHVGHVSLAVSAVLAPCMVVPPPFLRYGSGRFDKLTASRHGGRRCSLRPRLGCVCRLRHKFAEASRANKLLSTVLPSSPRLRGASPRVRSEQVSTTLARQHIVGTEHPEKREAWAWTERLNRPRWNHSSARRHRIPLRGGTAVRRSLAHAAQSPEVDHQRRKRRKS